MTFMSMSLSNNNSGWLVRLVSMVGGDEGCSIFYSFLLSVFRNREPSFHFFLFDRVCPFERFLEMVCRKKSQLSLVVQCPSRHQWVLTQNSL